MDVAKFQNFLTELKAGPQASDVSDDELAEFGFPAPDEMIEDGVDPQFVLYSTVQVQLLTMAAMLEQSGIVDEYHEILESALDTYMPGFPPMSPVTDSFFHSWALCDLTFGDDGDNIGRIAADMMAEMGMPTELWELCGKLLNSRMGIYETIDIDSDLIVVRELVTGRELLVDVPTGYFGSEGELRFVRLGPPAVHDAEYFTELTTPYILEGRSAADWTRYLKSVMPDSDFSDDGSPSTLVEDRLAAVFNVDLGEMPWMEFVFQGYRGYEEDVIFLSGIPNEPALLPHHDSTVATNSKIGIDSELARQAKSLGITIIPPGRGLDDDIEVALTDAQRQAAADLMPHLSSVFKPATKGKKRILLPEADWETLSDLVTAQLTREIGRGRTRLRNLQSEVDAALSSVDSPRQSMFGVSKSPQANAETETIYRMRIDLRGAKPPIWRRIEVPDCTLAELHVAIQRAIGWTDSHLHQFEIDGEGYSCPSPFGGDEYMDTIDSTNVWLSEVIRGKGTKFDYLYDFGDSWEHTIKVEAVEPSEPSVVYPRCLTGKRNCPPEDCGGIWGYENLLEILSDPEHPEYEDRIDWCGELDPEKFNAAECSREMQSRFSAVKQPRRHASTGSTDFDIRKEFFDDDGEIDDDEFQEWCTRLLNKFAGSPEFNSLPNGNYGFVDYLLQSGAKYLGVSLATMSVPDLNEIVFEIIPRKTMVEVERAADVIREFNAFFRFVGREYSLASAKKLADVLNDQAATRLGKELGTESSFGMAKSFFAQGKAAGYDMTSPHDLNLFATAYNNEVGLSHSGSGSEGLSSVESDDYEPTIRRQSPRIGRNDPCHCGSGRKYKKCCLNGDQ
jgi:hypothetical protein